MKSLQQIGGPAAATALIDLFTNPPTTPPHARWRVNAVRALGPLRDVRAVEPLKSWTYRTQSDSESDQAIFAIGMVDHPDATSALIDLVTGFRGGSAESVRIMVAKVLGVRGDERAIEPLKSFAQDAVTKPGRFRAVEAIARIGGPAAEAALATEPLRSWLNDPERKEIGSLSDELVDIGNGRGFLPSSKRDERTREIGQRLHEIGGKKLMQEVYKDISGQLRRPPRELDVAWDRVGDWLG